MDKFSFFYAVKYYNPKHPVPSYHMYPGSTSTIDVMVLFCFVACMELFVFHLSYVSPRALISPSLHPLQSLHVLGSGSSRVIVNRMHIRG